MIFDCDVHNSSPMEVVLDYLDEPYRSEVARFGYRKLFPGIRWEDGGSRADATAPDGRRGGSDPAWTAEDHLDRRGIARAVLSHNSGAVAGIPDPDYAAAVCRATNDAALAYWLAADDRYLMTACVALQDPQQAAAEVERLGGHPRVVAAGIFATAHRIPLGQRFYWPLFAAAERAGLPLHVHPSTTSVIANAASLPTGMATNYLQSHTCLPQFYMSDLVSLVLEGVFERFPGLRVILVEGGVSWLPHVMWRMDKEYQALRHEAPFLRRLPSAYVRDHVRLTTQPIEEPPRARQLVQIYEMVDAARTLLFASDYPHFDADEPGCLPKQLGPEVLERIYWRNAIELFALEETMEEAGAAQETAAPAASA